jgi:hypothetical protein
MPQQPRPVRLPASQFYCLLDEQPTHLVPLRFLVPDTERSATGPLFVNPHCHFSRDRELPAEVAELGHLPESFAWEGAIAWVRDPGSGITLPFWLGPRFSALLEGLHPGDAAPTVLPPDARSILAAAGVLVEEDYAERRSKEWAEGIKHCAARFRENSYVPIGRLLHPYHLAALRRYYRYLMRKGELHANPNLNPRRYGAHNETVARFFHLQLTEVVAAITGESVKPSYAYVASYQGGAELYKHTDREPCVFTISLCLDFSPEPVRETPWPLHVETRAGKLRVYQAIGDGLFFRGQELPHYREPLTKGNTSTSFFFHWVPADFSGPLD